MAIAFRPAPRALAVAAVAAILLPAMGKAMEVSFVRVRGQRDRIYVRRSDGSEVSWVFPTYDDGLPHDLVHLVVEAAFGLHAGFWGRVDAGVDPARVNGEANRQSGADKYRGFGDDRRELLLAEGLAGAAWIFDTSSDDERRARIAADCARLGVELPDTVTTARLGEVRAALAALAARWREIGEKGTIVLRFAPEAPAESFAAMAPR